MYESVLFLRGVKHISACLEAFSIFASRIGWRQRHRRTNNKGQKTGSNNGIPTTTTPTQQPPPQQPPTPTPPKPPTTPPTTITLTPTTTPPPTEKRRAGGHPGGRIDGISYAAHWKREISRLNLPLHSLSNAKCCVPKKWVQLQRCSS